MSPTHQKSEPPIPPKVARKDPPITAWDVYQKRVNDNTLPMRFWVSRLTLLAIILGILGKMLLHILRS